MLGLRGGGHRLIASDKPLTRSINHENIPKIGTKVNHQHILLLGLETTLVVLAFLLVLAWYFSNQRSGLNITVFSQYVLTYTPTAILLVIVTGWRQVDYACKTSAPWLAMSRGPIPATKSVLLDYVSTFQLFSFYQSMKNKHFQVSLGILGFVFLKIATVVSTGLLVLENHHVAVQQEVPVLTAFDGSMYNSSDFASLQDQSSAYTAFGILTQQMQAPFGSSPAAAYATFSRPEEHTANATFAVVVDALYPKFTCKAVNISINMAPENTTDINPDHEIQLPYINCDTNPGTIWALNPAQFLCPPRQLSGKVNPFRCNMSDSQEEWILLTLTDISYTQTSNSTEGKNFGDYITTTNSTTTITNTASVACQMSYSMGKLNISGDLESFNSSLAYQTVDTPVGSTLEGFSAENLTSLVDLAVSAASNMFGRNVDNFYALEYPTMIFNLMASTLPQNSYVGLMNDSVLASAAQAAYQQLAVQVVDRYVRTTTDLRLNSTVTKGIEVLLVTEVSAWIMVGGFLCTCLIGVVLMRMQATSHPHVQSILRMADVIKNSPETVPLLSDCQGRSENEIRHALGGQEFSTGIELQHDDIAILPHGGLKESDVPSTGHNERSTQFWWKQLTISYWFLSLTFGYAVGVIVVLEILQHTSKAGHGIATIRTQDETFESVFTHYLPTLAIVLLGTMFNSLDFNVLLLQPYHNLTKGSTKPDLLLRPMIYCSPIFSFWSSLRHCDVAAIGSSTAAFIAAILTIVVSGLYSIQTIPYPRQIDMNSTSIMLPTWDNSVSDDGGASILLSLTENLNLSYPPGTFKELFYIQPVSDDMKAGLNPLSSTTNQVVEVQMAAYRANLTCDTAQVGQFNVSLATTRIQKSATISTINTYPLPPSCQLGGPGGNESFARFSHTFNIASNATDAYVGKLLDYHVGPFDDVQGTDAGEFAGNGDPRSPNPDNPPGCPSLVLIYGYLSPDDIAQSSTEGAFIDAQQLAVQVCYQNLHTLSMNATFEGTALSLAQNDSSVEVDESSATSLSVPINQTQRDNGISDNETAYQFRIQKHFDNSLSFFGNSNNSFNAGSVSESTVDRFFQGVIFGRYSIPLERLQLRNQDDFDVLQQGILGLYRRYMAQAMSRKMTIGVKEATAQQTADHERDLRFTGMFMSGDGSSRRRLVQHNKQKNILQCLISVMVVGGLVAVSTTKLMKLLPAHANPCTIWGQMGIWVGSEWCSLADNDQGQSSFVPVYDLRKGASVANSLVVEDAKLKRQRFQLGWWTSKKHDARIHRWYGIDMIKED